MDSTRCGADVSSGNVSNEDGRLDWCDLGGASVQSASAGAYAHSILYHNLECTIQLNYHRLQILPLWKQ